VEVGEASIENECQLTCDGNNPRLPALRIPLSLHFSPKTFDIWHSITLGCARLLLSTVSLMYCLTDCFRIFLSCGKVLPADRFFATFCES
jgi:hypothetical protein